MWPHMVYNKKAYQQGQFTALQAAKTIHGHTYAQEYNGAFTEGSCPIMHIGQENDEGHEVNAFEGMFVPDVLAENDVEKYKSPIAHPSK